MFKGTRGNTPKDQYEFQIEQELERLSHFYAFVDSEIAKTSIEWGKQITVEKDGDGEEQLVGPVDEVWKLKDYPQLLYSSIFIALYSFLEMHSIKLVKEFEINNGRKARSTGFKCNLLRVFKKQHSSKLDGLNSLSKYLKTLGIDLKGTEIVFEKMDYYRNIRNALVHSGGYVKDEKKSRKLRVEIRKDDSLHYTIQNKAGGYITISKSKFLKDFGVFIPKFLDQIFSKLYP